MTTFEQTLLREVATLPESRQADVLAFIRFLKISLPEKEKIKADFKEALKDAGETAKDLTSPKKILTLKFALCGKENSETSGS